MGGMLYLQKVKPNGNGYMTTSSIQFPNTSSVDIDYDTGVTANPIPQQNDQQTILVKIVGNSTVITITSVIKDTSAAYISGSDVQGAITTLWEIIGFLDQKFQGTSITDQYRILVADSFSTYSGGVWSPLDSQNNPYPTPNPAYYSKYGFVTHMKLHMDSMAPVSFTVTFTFQVGTVVTTYNSVLPDQPTNFTANTAVSHQVALSWTAPTIPTGDPAITGYVVQRTTPFATGWVTIATPAGTSYTDTGLTTGTIYEYQVAAVTANGTGDFTNIVAATVT